MSFWEKVGRDPRFYVLLYTTAICVGVFTPAFWWQ